MPTSKQIKVAELIVNNLSLDEPLNGGEMLEKVRYSKGIQKQPSRVLQSEGVKEHLEVLGFSETKAKEVVSEIMLNPKVDPSDRLKATDQVFKVNGSYNTDEQKNINVLIPVLVRFLDKKDDTRSDNGDTNRISEAL